ncbi:DUF3606 domain-containing protein [Aestuariivirga sp.]|uniref:DUF3606 domain-containing protein n=1 Tax=Aestuariivirga sp. TaxID=2650926 RepID=UPI0039E474A8
MADNKKKTGASDRRTVAKGEKYEVAYFARKHGITAQQTRDLIDKVGNDREKLNKAAEKLKGKKPAKKAKKPAAKKAKKPAAKKAKKSAAKKARK